jgi:hypothetical protein
MRQRALKLRVEGVSPCSLTCASNDAHASGRRCEGSALNREQVRWSYFSWPAGVSTGAFDCAMFLDSLIRAVPLAMLGAFLDITHPSQTSCSIGGGGAEGVEMLHNR